MQSFSLDYARLYLRPALEERYIEGWVGAAWRGSERIIPRRTRSSGTSGRTRLSGRWL